MQTIKLANSATTSGALTDQKLDGSGAESYQAAKTFQATGATTAGAGSATVQIEVSNDRVGWITAGTITLTLSTTAATDGFVMSAPWGHVRANVTAISGTGANVTVTMGV